MPNETIPVECGHDGCPHIAYLDFDIDSGNARFSMDKGWLCLPVWGTKPTLESKPEYWFVCPDHAAMAKLAYDDYLRAQQAAALIEAAARARAVSLNAAQNGASPG